MVNYQNGKIYKIVDKTNNNIYIGSTAEKYLSRRLQHHISHYKQYIDGKIKYMTSFEIFKNNHFEILLLETYPCNSRYELEQKERYYIENNTCVNKNIPTRTDKEYREVNKDKKKEYDKEYRENNKTELNQKSKEYYEKNKSKINQKHKEYRENNKDKNKQKIICDLCGSQVRKYGLVRHKKSEKCKRLSICMIEDD